MTPHSHQWINPNDPPIERSTYVPWFGDRRREMKPGVVYVCRECGATLGPKDFSDWRTR